MFDLAWENFMTKSLGKDTTAGPIIPTRRSKVQVWVYFKNPESGLHLFLVLKTRPDRGGFWQPVTGGVEEDERLDDAAQREAEEETGLEFLDPPTPVGAPFEFLGRPRTDGLNERVQEHGFSLLAVVDEEVPPSVRLDPHEHTEFRWVTAKDALQMVHFPSNADVLKQLLKELMSR
jgi:dATP pyrophosphohydrolase